jgi:hypothetical protein
MKIIKTLLLVILILSGNLSVSGQKSSPKSKIKSIVVLEEKHDVLVKKQYKESETYYNANGNILEEISYKQGKVKKHFKYQYNSDGKKIKEEEFDPSGRITESSEYKYENGMRVEKIVYDGNNKIKTRKIYQYTTF